MRARAARDARRKPVASIRDTAIRMLARREYARAEIEQRLLARGADAAEVTRTLDDLERLGYLSDARFARMLVAQKAGRFGKRAIAHAIRERRVEPSAAREALEALAEHDEVADARTLWQRRFGVAPSDDRERARQLRFLVARGYSVSVAIAVIGRRVGSAVEVDAPDVDVD
jgi:regulatory protein